MTASIGGVRLAGDDLNEDRFKVLIHGPQGSGKTWLASTIGEVGKTLFVDIKGEHGTRSFRGSPQDKNIDIVRPGSVTDLDDIFWELNSGNHPYEAVCLDSLTGVQKMSMRYILGHSETAVKEIQQGTAPADQRSWGQTLDIMTDTAVFWYGLAEGGRAKPMHVIMTAQSRWREDEDSGDAAFYPDVQRGALSVSLATPDYIMYTQIEEDLDAETDVEDDSPHMRHVVRFLHDPRYRTKARIPYPLRGKMPAVLGRKSPVGLPALGRILQIGGIPKTKAATVKTN